MTWEWLAVAGLALVALGLLLVLGRVRAQAAGQVAEAIAETRRLQQRVDRLERQLTRPTPAQTREEREYRITHVGEPQPTSEPARLERAVFADLLLRESVIRIGSLAHGVRRAMSPESRNRIRFEMRRELKRARKQRRSEQREAYREWQARQRDRLPDDDLRNSA